MPAPNGMDPRHWEYISQRLGKKTYADGDVITDADHRAAPPPPPPPPPRPPSAPVYVPQGPELPEVQESRHVDLPPVEDAPAQEQTLFRVGENNTPKSKSDVIYGALDPIVYAPENMQKLSDALGNPTPARINRGMELGSALQERTAELIPGTYEHKHGVPQPSADEGKTSTTVRGEAAKSPPGDNPVGVSQPPAPKPVALAQYVPAHEEPKVNPARQEALGEAIDAEGNAVLAAGDIKENAMNVGADAQMAAAQQESADLDRIAENQKARQDYLDKLGQDIDQDSKGMSQKTYDPDRLWNSKSTAQKIFGIIAMALGGFVQGVHGGRNGPADMIEESIKEDIGAQKEQLNNQWADIKQRHSVLSEKATRYGSMDVAERQQVAARLQGALLMAQAAAARATSPVERANATALAAQLEQKAIMAGIEMNKWVNAGYAGGAGGANEHPSGISTEELYNLGGGKFLATGDAERARALEKQNNAADLVANNAQEMLAILTGPNYARAYVPGTAEYGAIRALSKSMAVQDVSDASGGASSGRSLGLLNVYSQVQGNLSNPLMIGSVKKALQTLADEAQSHKEIRLQGYAGAPIVTVRVYKDHSGAMKRGVFMSADGETFEPPKKKSPASAGPSTLTPAR